ncbi:hypothetical protein EC844_111104 [Acinetobacter calcoaceticus]|uniref:DUF7079 domain-containing protein n=1 Tax=Acinetobacter calcoaceticus TaxID=471 RepID=A0A4R1XR86_ACICA|nr:hypothetical protein EC844_111104 [Acinetobacter calcoaceticus]
MWNLENLWFSLSGLFIDNEVDYKSIAEQISSYDIDTIEFYLFYNVAPVCSINIEQTIPVIWSFFDKNELIQDIKLHGISSTDQITLKRKIAAKLYKFKYKKEWEILKGLLRK